MAQIPELMSSSSEKTRVTTSLRQATRQSYVTQNVLLTVAAFRPWRGSQCPAAQDPVSDEAMKSHERRTSRAMAVLGGEGGI